VGNERARFTTDVERLLYFGFDPNEVRRFQLEPAELVLLFDSRVADDPAVSQLLHHWATGKEAPGDWLVSTVHLWRLAPPSQN
jgi:hypothetical protein